MQAFKKSFSCLGIISWISFLTWLIKHCWCVVAGPNQLKQSSGNTWRCRRHFSLHELCKLRATDRSLHHKSIIATICQTCWSFNFDALHPVKHLQIIIKWLVHDRNINLRSSDISLAFGNERRVLVHAISKMCGSVHDRKLTASFHHTQQPVENVATECEEEINQRITARGLTFPSPSYSSSLRLCLPSWFCGVKKWDSRGRLLSHHFQTWKY